MPRLRHATLVWITAFVGAAGIVACTLNPQPLPPTDDDDPTRADPNEQAPGVGASADGAAPTVPEPKPADAGSMFETDSAIRDGAPADSGADATVDGATDGSTASDAGAD